MVIRGYYAHDTPEGVTPRERTWTAGYLAPVFENLACGQTTPEAVVHAWLSSPGHCLNVMDAQTTFLGAARAANGDAYGTSWALELSVRPLNR